MKACLSSIRMKIDGASSCCNNAASRSCGLQYTRGPIILYSRTRTTCGGDARDNEESSRIMLRLLQRSTLAARNMQTLETTEDVKR